MSELRFTIPAELLDEIARRVVDLLHDRTSDPAPSSPWLSVAEAAEYLRCKPKRVYDLVSQQRLPGHHDGGRLLLRRDEIDIYLSDPADTPLTPAPNTPRLQGIVGGTRSTNPARRAARKGI